MVPGAGAFEVAAHTALNSQEFLKDVKGRQRLGIKVRVWPIVVNGCCQCEGVT